MLTLGMVVRATRQDYVSKSSKYRSDLFKIDKSKNDKGEHIRVVGVISGGAKPRRTIIRCYDKDISISSPCMVSCSCELFAYELEIALAVQGSAVLPPGARMPVKRNSGLVPGLCPHLVFLAKLALAPKTTKDAEAKKQPKISPKLKKQ